MAGGTASKTADNDAAEMPVQSAPQPPPDEDELPRGQHGPTADYGD